MRVPSTRVLAALAAVTLWSTNAWAADLALARMSLGWLLLVQYGMAATALLAVRAVARRRVHAPAGHGPLTVPAAAIGVVGLTGTIFLQYLAFATAPIVAANVLAYGWPLLAALWVAATLRTRRAVGLAALALLGFGGVALIFSSPAAADPGADGDTDATWGYVAALGSAVCMAIYTLAASRVHVRATDLLIPATLLGTLAAAAVTASTSSSWPQATGWLAAAYIGLGPMAAGYGLWTLAMAHGGAERLAPIGYATPLLSTILLLATGAPATATTLIGVGLVLACSIGVLASQHPPTRARTDTAGTRSRS
jgi:drug/metabolite transporter (DMT)-like permease